MDWNNVDLNDGYERSRDILDGYSFDSLLLEIGCNLREINEETIRKQFEESLQSKIECAREVFEINAKSILCKAKEERDGSTWSEVAACNSNSFNQ